MALTVNLIGPSPWGFRIYGGRDFKKAITISKVNEGGKAEQADLQPGDIILEINGENTADLLNAEAQYKIKNSKTNLQLVVERPESSGPGQTNGTLEQLTGRFQEVVKVNRDENQNYREYTISSPVSRSPGPYSPDPPASPDGRMERVTPTINKSFQLCSWSPEEKSKRLSRPLSQAIIKNLTEEQNRRLNALAHYIQKEWRYFSHSVYYISSIKKSWKDSRKDCLQRSADLVIINSKEEQNFVRQFKNRAWIGLTDTEKEGTWKWVDGTPPTISYWDVNEPNSDKGRDEDCGELHFYEKENCWNDTPCDTPKIWICEKNLTL